MNFRQLDIKSGHEPPLKVKIFDPDTVPDRHFYDSEYYMDGQKAGKSGYVDYKYANYHLHQADTIMRTLKPKSVLDVGCATGPLVMAFKLFQIRSAGVDLSEWATSHPCFPGIELKCASSAEIPYGDKEFELVTCLDMLEHLPSLEIVEKTVSELCRCSGQYVWIATPFDNDSGKWNMDKSHIFFAEKRFWLWEFEKHGFTEYPGKMRVFNDYGDEILFTRG